MGAHEEIKAFLTIEGPASEKKVKDKVGNYSGETVEDALEKLKYEGTIEEVDGDLKMADKDKSEDDGLELDDLDE